MVMHAWDTFTEANEVAQVTIVIDQRPWYLIFNHIKNEFCLVIEPLYADPGENFNNYCAGQFLDSFSAMQMKLETSSDL